MLTTIEHAVQSLLSSPDPEALAIKGSWGVGKTYWWKKRLKHLTERTRYRRYSYVSLFGVNSLKELEFKIFQQAVALDELDSQRDIDHFFGNVLSNAAAKLRKHLDKVDEIQLTSKYLPDLKSIASLSVYDYLICLDDFERKGKNLSSREVMGLASFLKEEKNCTIVMILNEDVISDAEENIDEYITYKEKLIDVEVEFHITSEIASKIALDDAVLQSHVKKYIFRLNITNIRIIKKINRIAKKIDHLIIGCQEKILDDIAMSIVVFCWSNYTKDKMVPSLQFILRYYSSSYFGVNNLNGQEQIWKHALDDYGDKNLTEVDLEIADFICKGYLNEDVFKERLERVRCDTDAESKKDKFILAVDNFWNCLECNQEEAVTELSLAYRKAVQHLEVHNLESLVYIYESLGMEEEVSTCIDMFIEASRDDNAKLNLRENVFAKFLNNERIRQALNLAFEKNKPRKSFDDIIQKIIRREICDEGDAIIMSQSNVEEYTAAFKKLKGHDLTIAMDFIESLKNAQMGVDNETTIFNKARLALEELSNQCKINQIRLSRYKNILKSVQR